LSENETFRWLAPPFIPQRMDYYQTSHASQAAHIPAGPCHMQFSWGNGQLHWDSMTFGRFCAQDMIQRFLHVYPQELEGDNSLTKMEIKGDLVVRTGLDGELYRAMLEKIISEAAGTTLTLQFREVERPAIVFTGNWDARNVDGSALPANQKPQRIEIYGANLSDPPTGCNDSRGTVDTFAKSVGAWIDRTVIVEAWEAPRELSWRFRHVKVGTRESARLSRDPMLVCMHIQQQTGLEHREEVRPLRRLFVNRRI
jgi:hypothetical protein